MMLLTSAMLMALAPPQSQNVDPAFEQYAASCGTDAERFRAIARFFDLRGDQTIAEYQASFTVTGCVADAVRERGHFIAAVDGGDRIAYVARRLAVQKLLKRDAARFRDAALVEVKPGKAPLAERINSIDRLLIVGQASDMLLDRKRASGLLRALGEMTKAGGLLGVVDVPDGGVDVAVFTAVAREAGWEAVGETTTGPDGLLLLKFRRI